MLPAVIFWGRQQHRIRALREFQLKATGVFFYRVMVGDLGGWVETPDNLSHTGAAWVAGDAHARGHSRVTGDALLTGAGCTDGHSTVQGRAVVGEHACMFGNSTLGGDAQLLGHAYLAGDVLVSGNTVLRGVQSRQ